MGEKGVDLGGAHVVRMALIVKQDEAAGPIYAEGLLGRILPCGRSNPARGCYAMFEANGIAHTFGKLSASLIESFFAMCA